MHTYFEDRVEAGKVLAGRLKAFEGTDSVVLGVPRGGVPVAAEAARVLRLPWSVIVVKKLAVPWLASASFGAVAGGALVLNEAMVHGLGLHKEVLKPIVEQARQDAQRWSDICGRERPEPDITGKCAIVVDDGLASGYTMMAAIKFLRERGASRVVAASPVVSRFASAVVRECADECIFEMVSPTLPFSISDFYLTRHELSEEDVLAMLRQV